MRDGTEPELPVDPERRITLEMITALDTLMSVLSEANRYGFDFNVNIKLGQPRTYDLHIIKAVIR